MVGVAAGIRGITPKNTRQVSELALQLKLEVQG
jgi:hypothetical protein